MENSNADDEIVLNVTQEDIDFGERGDPQYCAIARCARRTTGANNVKVISSITIGRRWWPITQVMRSFIERFDCRAPVEPTTFRLKCSEGHPTGR